MKKSKWIVGLCALAGMMVLLAGMEISAFATEAGQTELLNESAVTEEEVNEAEIVDESLYPDWWDDEDPQNARAYMQLYGEAESETRQPLLEAGSSDTSAYTTTWKLWMDTKFTSTYHQTFTHSETSAANRDICAAIDVSYFQGDIDWEKVREAGIQYAFIRVGYRGYKTGALSEDSKFREYIEGAQEAGLEVGVYFFSQATTEAEAVEEAEFVLNKLSKYGYSLDLPIVIDYEYYSDGVGRLYEANQTKTKAEKTAVVNAFLARVTKAGYSAMVYSSSAWFVTELDAESISQNYKLWMARYNSYAYKSSETNRYGGKIDVWQCSSNAQVDGIDGRVDLNWIYLDKAGFQCGTDGNWYYIYNGKVQTDVTSIIYGTVDEETAWWYVKNGKVTFTTTVAKNSNGWWYVENGKVNFDYTGVAKNANGWWRIENGKVNFSFTGFGQNANGWWYCKNGKVDFTKTDIIKGTVNGESGWWYVVGGKVQLTTTTVAKNANGWWYVENGKVNFDYTGVAKNANGWWRIENGKVNFGFTGFAQNTNGWWYLSGGKVIFSKTDILKGTVNGSTGWWYVVSGKVQLSTTTVAKNVNGWWYVENGKVNFGYTGVAKNANGWWRIENGKVNFSFTGFGENTNGWWYLKNGKVDFTKTDVMKGTVNGSTGWWYVSGGKVQLGTTTVAKNANGWWYVKDGKVDFTYTGVAENQNGTWYIVNGKVSFGTTGTVTVGEDIYTVSNGRITGKKTIKSTENTEDKESADEV